MSHRYMGSPLGRQKPVQPLAANKKKLPNGKISAFLSCSHPWFISLTRSGGEGGGVGSRGSENGLFYLIFNWETY